MIDRIRSEIQDRLDQLLSEADKLRRALNALDPRDSASAAASSSKPVTTVRGDRSSIKSAAPSPARTRTASGETKRAVLAALDSEKGLTAGEVAAATGLARPTVSTTLSKLATSGEILKVQRGYQLAGNGTAAAVK